MEQAALKGRSEHILSHTEALRRETEEMRVEIAQKKAKLLRRRSDLKSATDGLSQREAIDIEPLERAVRKMEHRWDAMHAKSRESRVFLCREAAQLYGLQQRKRKKGSTGKELYLIGGMPIANLRDLNSKWFLLS